MFVAYVVDRHNRTQADLVDQLFNSSEKRLARARVHPDALRLSDGRPMVSRDSSDARPPVRHTFSSVVASDHTPMRIPRNVTVHPGPSGRIFDTIDRTLEEVEWLLNYARNANKPIPVASAITTKKVSAPRRLTPMRLLNPLTHRQRTKSANVPEINPEAGSPGAARFGNLFAPPDRIAHKRGGPNEVG